jgi:hypothetical protein
VVKSVVAGMIYPFLAGQLALLTYSKAPICLARRNYASSSEPDLKETMKRIIPAKRELLKKVKAHSDKKLGDVKVENALGGMRYVNLSVDLAKNKH